MELPTEFLSLAETLTLGGMGIVLFLVVEATKELPWVTNIPTLLYAWIVGTLFLFAGTAIRAGAEVHWGETVYLSIVNGIIVAAVAVLTHQSLTRTGIIRKEDY